MHIDLLRRKVLLQVVFFSYPRGQTDSRQTYRQTYRQTDRQTADKHTDKHTDRQTDSQTDRYIHIPKYIALLSGARVNITV